jgi:predicted RNase H-like nuclease (RuvC/YqgF family)
MTKYYSKSRGELIYVAEMSDVHVRRAFIKMLDDDARHEELVESERMIKTLRQDNNAYKQRISELAEENELYKEENARLKEQGNNYHYSPTDAQKINDAYRILFDNNEELLSTNKKLKQDLEKLKDC